MAPTLPSDLTDTLQSDPGGGGGPAVPGGRRYDQRQLLARGGQSEVYVAWDSHLRREVALKRPRTDGGADALPAIEARFLREARISARLEHPNVITVHEIGRDEDGGLFCTQRLVHGPNGGPPATLGRALADCATPEARLALLPRLLDVCTGVAHAHGRGITHRDLKPDNVVLGGPNETVVLDWGLARDRGNVEELTASDSSDNFQTLDGQVFGTPLYMSPEQARGQRDLVDERSDVWSLGAMLFEFVTGRPPFTGRSPVEVITSVRDAPVPDVLSLAPRAPRALAAICRRALERDRSRRYPDAAALATDLRAFLENRQVGVHAYSLLELLQLFFHRYRTTALVAATALVVLLLTLGALLVSVRRANDALAEASIERGRLAEGGLRWDQAAIWYAAAFETSGRRDAATGAWLAAQRPAASGITRLTGHTLGVRALASTADGALFASAGTDRSIKLWRPSEPALVRTLRGHTDSVTSLGFSRDGEALWSVSEDRTVRRWLVGGDEGEVVATLPDRLNAVVVLDGDRGVLVACESGEIFSVVRGAPPRVFGRHVKPAYALALSPSGEELFSGSYQGDLKRWRIADGVLLTELPAHIGSVLTLAVSRDGTRLASAGRDTTVRLWAIEEATLRPLQLLSGHTQRVYGLAWGTGNLLASVSADGTSRVWMAQYGAPLRSQSRGEPDELAAVTFLPGDRLAWAGRSGVVSLRQLEQPPLQRQHLNLEGLDVLPDGRVVVSELHQFKLLDGETLKPVFESSTSSEDQASVPKSRVAASPDGAVLIGNCGANCLGWWDLRSSRMLGTTTAHEGEVSAMALSRDGRFAATVGVKPSVHVFDRERRTTIAKLGAHASGGFGVAFSPDGRFMATADYDKHVVLWETAGFTEVRRFEGHEHGVRAVTFSPDSTRLASVSWDRSARVWQVDTGAELARFYHQDFVFGVDWHPDGVRLATGSHDGNVRIWDTVEKRELVRYPADEAQVSAVRFSRDGRVLYYAGRGVHRVVLEPSTRPPRLADLLARSGLRLDGTRLVPSEDRASPGDVER